MKEEVVLLMCGSFSPITNMHLRMMELAKDHLEEYDYNVHRGFMSPVHDSYGKQGLLPAFHRRNMVKKALASSDWLELSSWESEQETWTNTLTVINHHQSKLDLLLSGSCNEYRNSSNDINGNLNRVKVKMVCGADLLESFVKPNVWRTEDVQVILKNFGLIVITRSGYDIDGLIYDNDILYENKKNVFVVREYIENTVSSTKIRTACARGLSIKYLVPDDVERYIKDNKLFSSTRYKYKKSTKTGIQIPTDFLNYISFSATSKRGGLSSKVPKKVVKQRGKKRKVKVNQNASKSKKGKIANT